MTPTCLLVGVPLCTSLLAAVVAFLHAFEAAQQAARDKELLLAAQRVAATAGVQYNTAAVHRLRTRPVRRAQPVLHDDRSAQCSPPPPPRDDCWLTLSGRRCVFPFRWKGRWRRSCGDSNGLCAVQVDSLGRARRLSNCTVRCPRARVECVGFKRAPACGYAAQESGEVLDCGSADEPDVSGHCLCSAGVSVFVGCGVTRRSNRCAVACADVAADGMSHAHAARSEQETAAAPLDELVSTVTAACRNAAPRDAMDLGAWERFADRLPKDPPAGSWCGRGVAIMAGSPDTLPQALVTAAFIRGRLNSSVPIEMWRAPGEPEPRGDMRAAADRLGVFFRTLPEAIGGPSTTDLFSFKPAVALLSSFDTVLLLDADAVPLESPQDIMRMLPPSASAVFWPDFWTLLYDARIWNAVGGWPHRKRHMPSQDSGVMVVCKSCGGWRALAIAVFLNFHESAYYPAIYHGHWSERICHDRRCVKGHDVPGAGDKDTFLVAWVAARQAAVMMPPAAVAGPILPKRGHVCGTAFVQRDLRRRPVLIHHNSNKWWWRDWNAGNWVTWRGGLGISHVAMHVNESQSYFADGVNDWRSVTYGNRADAGRQQVPLVSRWCIVYKGDVSIDTLQQLVGWDVEGELLGYLQQYYAAPWMVNWVASSSSILEALAECAVRRGWVSSDMAETQPEDVRNTVIVRLSEAKEGTVAALQGKSDHKLAALCSRAGSQRGTQTDGD
eukprot:TRINITY_DN26878_c0_g1_i1.p1 TRINITY_DN26878_c0_g1~~TRINITY_DN26878_c0_g1_i1.p1  ORF type:complete len:783 (+),score=215.17 TRINITY_DN26878_c0_g1_i1:178-2349(+)